MRRILFAVSILWCVMAAPVAGQDLVPLGLEFQVNTVTTGAQQAARIAASRGTGAFLVVWESTSSEGTDTDSFSIQARRLTSDGAPIGSDLQVNTYTTGIARRPAVAGDGNGNFVVAWQSNGSYGNDTDYSIQARRIGPDGVPIGNQFQVNTFRFNFQQNAGIAANDEAGSSSSGRESALSPATRTTGPSMHGSTIRTELRAASSFKSTPTLPVFSSFLL